MEYLGLLTNTFIELANSAPVFIHICLSTSYWRQSCYSHYRKYHPDPSVEGALGILSVSSPHPQITSLSLYFHKVDPELIQGLKLEAVFPCLKYLQVTMPTPEVEYNKEEEPVSRLIEKVECFNIWRALKQIEFEVVINGSIKNAIYLLDSFTKFDGMKLVKNIMVLNALKYFNFPTIAAERKIITLRATNLLVSNLPLSNRFPRISRSVLAALLASHDLTSLSLQHLKVIQQLMQTNGLHAICNLPNIN